MTEPKIFDKKPAMVTLEPGTYFWCACGLSTNQPFCSGMHKGTGITPLKFEVEEKKDAWLCNCKHSGNKPFCDGTHKTL